MSSEKYNQIIDEAYKNYITQIRLEFENFRKMNPDVLVNYREDSKQHFLKSIKEDKHWFTGEKNFSEKWGLKIVERELSFEERAKIYWDKRGINDPLLPALRKDIEKDNIPTKLITLTYKDETIENYGF